MTDYKLNPDYIPASHLPAILYRDGYRPSVEYHQVYYAVTHGDSGAVRDHTKHWFLHRDQLARLAKRLKLTRPAPPATSATAPAPLPPFDDDTIEAAESWVDAVSSDTGTILQPDDRDMLARSVAGYLETINDSGNRYWSTRSVEALRGIFAMSHAAVDRGRKVASDRPAPLIPPDELMRDETIRTYSPASIRSISHADDDSVLEDC